MVRLAVSALLVCALVVVTGTSAIGQRPGPSPLAEDQRFEFPDHGLALTVPAGWRVTQGGQGLPIFDRVLVAREVGGAGRCIVETFEFDGVRPEEIAWTLSRIRGYRQARIAPAVELPAGEAVRLYAPDLPEQGQAGTSDTYVFATDDGYAWLTCSTTDAYPGRLWYTIAESIELLPAEPERLSDETTGPSSPPESSRRIEVREAGYAVTLPEDWDIEIVEEDSDTAILILTGPERFGPDVELQNLMVAWGPEGRERDTPNLCTLVRYAPIELTADEFLNEIFGQSEDLIVESVHEGLSRVFMNQFMTGSILTDSPGRYIELYAIGGGDAVALLWCTGALSYREEWLSIAESFEFLPVEE